MVIDHFDRYEHTVSASDVYKRQVEFNGVEYEMPDGVDLTQEFQLLEKLVVGNTSYNWHGGEHSSDFVEMEAEEAKQRRINAGRAGQRRGRSTGDRITGKSSINTPRGRSSMTENTESRSTAGRSGSSRTGGHTGSRSTSRSTGRSGNSHSSGRNTRSDSQNTGRRGAARFTNGRKRGK